MGGRHTAGPAQGHGHGHGHGPHAEVDVRRGARAVLLGALAVAGVLALIGLAMLWPDRAEADRLREEVSFQGPGVSFVGATLRSVEDTTASVTLESGPEEGSRRSVGLPPEVAGLDLEPGDSLRLQAAETADGGYEYTYFGTDRETPLWLLAGLFVLVVLLVARWRGLLALLGLGFAGLVLLGFVLPALLTGEPGLAVGLVASTLIMVVVLYTTHGFSLRTSAALAGTLVGLALTAGLGLVATRATRLTGFGSEEAGFLTTYIGGLDLQDVFTCALVVAGLGVLNDVTITQSSAVWELRGAAPELGRRRLFLSGMRIGRDHIASTIYTIVFAYAGTALVLMMVLSLYGLSIGELLATEEIAQEVVRTLVSSTGLVLAVPVTTAIAVWTVPGPVRMSSR
ncbi:YibE/F family protein [Nocardioides sp. Arc9.136]|uniref:YibE/F family protein n=1 Tax=Nocardioides sp. Arc9.136 TaxID=2996826 RepID=UPI002665C0BB|nr:YibE/F family protein [Nocardioides sp. Arc9.136]WKN48489.1 YibE/F family protein [Nocardioides sp. Arc9.136]